MGYLTYIPCQIFGRKFRALIGMMCVSFCVHAQFNDSTFYYVYYSATGSYTKTNDLNATVLNNIVKFSIEKKNISFHTTNGWIYGIQSGVKINNDFSSVVESDILKKQQPVYYWAIGTFDKSYSLKINHRFQTGAGLGWTVVNKKNISVVLSDGVIYEQGDLINAEQTPLRYELWRNSARLKYRWVIHDIVTWDGTGFWQPSLTTPHDNIMKYSTTLSVKLKKWLSLTSAVTYNKLTLTGRENLIVTGGIVLEKFF